MEIYLSIYAGLAALGLLVPGRAPLALLVAVGVALAVFMGFRHEVGCDFTGYLNRYVNSPVPLTWEGLSEGPEAGFALLSGAMQSLGASYTQFLAVTSAILVACYLYFVRAHPNSLLILALLFPVVIVQLGMSGLRQALAGGLLMVASVSFQRGSRLGTAGWLLLATQFHVTAAVFLPMALLAGRTVSVWRIVLALAIMGPVMALLITERFDTISDRYITQTGGAITSGGAVFRYALILIPALAYPFYRRNLAVRCGEVFPLLQLFALISVFLAPLVLLSSIALHRLGFYVMPFSILLFVYLAEVAFKPGQAGLARALPVLTYGLGMTLWFLTSAHADQCYIPYQSTLWP